MVAPISVSVVVTAVLALANADDIVNGVGATVNNESPGRRDFVFLRLRCCVGDLDGVLDVDVTIVLDA